MPVTDTLIGLIFSLAVGLLILTLFALRKATLYNLFAIAAASSMLVFTIGTAYIHAQMPAGLIRVQQAYSRQSPSGQALITHYFAAREQNGFSGPITNAEFDALLKQVQTAAPPFAKRKIANPRKRRHLENPAIPLPDNEKLTTRI